MLSRTQVYPLEMRSRRNFTIRQSQVNMGEPWEPMIEIEEEITVKKPTQVEKGIYRTVRIKFYLVRNSEEQVVYQSMNGDVFTVLKEE